MTRYKLKVSNYPNFPSIEIVEDKNGNLAEFKEAQLEVKDLVQALHRLSKKPCVPMLTTQEAIEHQDCTAMVAEILAKYKELL